MGIDQHINNLLEKLQKIESVDMQDNIFSVLEITDKEVFHCRFLRYLIKNDWKGFCQNVLKNSELDADKNVIVECEYPCEHLECMQTELNSSKDGRVDILCQTDSAVVAIEVKWNAGDQPQQLLRYRKRLETLFPITKNKKLILVYLTLNGKTASACSTQCPAINCPRRDESCELREENYVRRSFTDVMKWIENENDEIIKQYRNVLQEEYNMAKISDCITENRENYFAANKVSEAIFYAQSKIRRAFMQALDTKIKADFSSDGIIINDADDGELKKYKYDKFVKSGECLAYRIRDDKYLLIWATTFLYWQLGKSCKYEKGYEWSYINRAWFKSNKVREKDINESNNNEKVDAKYLSNENNEIVELYFKNNGDVEKMADDECINNIVSNMKRYI